MIRRTRVSTGALWFAAAVLIVPRAGAQQKPQSASQSGPQSFLQRYDLVREAAVQGTVISYTEATSGAHVVLQTASGPLDVHLGNAKLLRNNHLSLSSGDNIRVIGENVNTAKGTQFLARILVKGNQQIALRSVRGIPFASSRPVADTEQSSTPQGGAL